MTTKHKKKQQKNKSALLIPAGLLLGIGFGFLFDNFVTSMFIGLGAGMIAFAILTFIKQDKKILK